MAATDGTEKHRYLEMLASGIEPRVALEQIAPDSRGGAAAIDLDPAVLRRGAPEVALALNIQRGTAREIGRAMTRASARAACSESEMPMLVDWVSIAGDTVVVVDWKTNAAHHVEPARSNAQVLTYAAAALLAYAENGARVVRAAVVRVDRDTPYWDITEPMDALDIENHLGEIRRLFAEVDAARQRYKATRELPDFHISALCDFCPSRRFCPAQVGQLHEALDFQPKEGSEFGGPVLRPAEAGAMYAKVLGAMELLKRFKADLEGIAKEEPLPLPDGRMLRWEDEAKASVDAEAAAPILARAYGPRVVELATKHHEPTMPWDALADALATESLPRLQEEHREKGGRKPTRGALIREARNLLEQNNAVRVHHYAAPRVVEVRGALESGDER